MSRLQTFLLDALADPANNEIYQKAVKAANSHDTTNVYSCLEICTFNSLFLGLLFLCS
jgi:hypothetical protein